MIDDEDAPLEVGLRTTVHVNRRLVNGEISHSLFYPDIKCAEVIHSLCLSLFFGETWKKSSNNKISYSETNCRFCIVLYYYIWHGAVMLHLGLFGARLEPKAPQVLMHNFFLNWPLSWFF